MDAVSREDLNVDDSVLYETVLTTMPGAIVLMGTLSALAMAAVRSYQLRRESLARFGLEPLIVPFGSRPRRARFGRERLSLPRGVPYLSFLVGEGSFVGRYKGWQAGYTHGSGARNAYTITIKREGWWLPHDEEFESDVQVGSEFWLSLPDQGPDFLIADRHIPEWPTVAKTADTFREVQTGNPSFDARFVVYSDDDEWMKELLSPEVQHHLQQLPVLCIRNSGPRIFYAFLKSMAQQIKIQLKCGYNFDRVLARGDLFLDSLVTLAERMGQIPKSPHGS